MIMYNAGICEGIWGEHGPIRDAGHGQTPEGFGSEN